MSSGSEANDVVINAGDSSGTSPAQTAYRLVMGGRIAQLVAAAVEIGLPDLIGDEIRTAEQLVQATGCHAQSLHRLLRALVALEVLEENGGYTLTAVGAMLRSDGPGLNVMARYNAGESRRRAWGALAYAVRTGESAFEHVFGTASWEYDQRHPAAARDFIELMTRGTKRQQEALLAAYDFSTTNTIVDVAGSHGQLLGAILQRHPTARGILFDQPHVVAGAPSVLAELQVLDRCTIIGGSMFDEVPAGGDLYLLKFILHDWDDARAAAILRTVRRAMAPRSTLLAIDRVLPAGDHIPLENALSDLHMLVMFAGKERTEQEFEELLHAAGLRVTRVIPTAGELSLIEARPA